MRLTIPVAINNLGANLVNEDQKAGAARSYLKRRGGLLVIEIHDGPGMGTPAAGQRKERLLFHIGVKGHPLKSTAEQYLNVQFGAPQANWQRHFNANGWTRAGLKTTGRASVAPRGNVSAPTRRCSFPVNAGDGASATRLLNCYAGAHGRSQSRRNA